MSSLPLVLRYPGSKKRIASWIVSHFPPHRVYVDLFCGSLSVLFAKPRSRVEIANDKDGRIVNLFRILRDRPEELIRGIALTPYAREEFHLGRQVSEDPVEDARRTLVCCWQSVGSTHNFRSGWRGDHRAHTPTVLIWRNLPDRLAAVVDRLQGVQIENADAFTLLAQRNDPDRLYYCDPPYPESVRRGQLYSHEMADEESHRRLLAAVKERIGPVVLSGYDNPLYREELADWQVVRTATTALTGETREECLWLNHAVTEALACRLPGLEESA